MGGWSGRGSKGARGRTRPSRYGGFRDTEGGRMSKVRPDSVKLLVSNLDISVTEHDVDLLFKEYRSYKSATLHYDQYSNSRGTAEAFFDRKHDAIKAMKEFNGRTLDGKEMEIVIFGLEREIALASQPLKREGRTRMDNWSQQPRSRRNRNAGVMKEDKGGAMGGWGGARKKRRPFIRKDDLKTEMKAKMGRNQRSKAGGKSSRNMRDEARGGAKRSWGGARNGRKTVISKDDLDAELDAYMHARSA